MPHILSTCKIGLIAIGLAFTSLPAQAEGTISIYSGANFSPHSRVNTSVPGVPNTSNGVGWDGVSFEWPPYYGVRGTWWFEDFPQFGLAIDYTHSKVKASPLPAGFGKLEFTDGINFLTANALYRHDLGNRFTPYGGVGVGVTIPHVEVNGPAVNNFNTFEFQLTGVAVQGFVGLDYEVNDSWSVFTEFKSTYGVVDATLNGGGTLNTHIISNQAIVGVTYKLY